MTSAYEEKIKNKKTKPEGRKLAETDKNNSF